MPFLLEASWEGVLSPILIITLTPILTIILNLTPNLTPNLTLTKIRDKAFTSLGI